MEPVAILALMVVFLAGSIGGFVASLLGPQNGRKKDGNQVPWTRRIPSLRKQWTRLWYQGGPEGQCCFPTALALALLGGIAAVVFWCINGVASDQVFLGAGESAADSEGIAVTFAELGGAVLIGIGGPGYLSTGMSLRCCERSEDRASKGSTGRD